MWLSYEKKIIPVSLKIKGNQDWMHSNEYDHDLEEKTNVRSSDGLVDSKSTPCLILTKKTIN